MIWLKSLKLKNLSFVSGKRSLVSNQTGLRAVSAFIASKICIPFLLIKDLLYQQGFTIAGAKKQLPVLLKGGAEAPVALEANAASTEVLCEEAACSDFSAASSDGDNDEDEAVQEEAMLALVPVVAEVEVQAVQAEVEPMVAAPVAEPENGTHDGGNDGCR